MYRLVSKLVIYRNLGKDCLLYRLADICRRFDLGDFIKEDLTAEIYQEIHNLLDISTSYGKSIYFSL